MGFNFKAAGFETLQAFVDAMLKSEDEHFKAFVNFIASKNLGKALAQHDWATFARKYNGPAYKQNNYDVKLARAYRRFTDGDVQHGSSRDQR